MLIYQRVFPRSFLNHLRSKSFFSRPDLDWSRWSGTQSLSPRYEQKGDITHYKAMEKQNPCLVGKPSFGWSNSMCHNVPFSTATSNNQRGMSISCCFFVWMFLGDGHWIYDFAIHTVFLGYIMGISTRLWISVINGDFMGFIYIYIYMYVIYLVSISWEVQYEL